MKENTVIFFPAYVSFCFSPDGPDGLFELTVLIFFPTVYLSQVEKKAEEAASAQTEVLKLRDELAISDMILEDRGARMKQQYAQVWISIDRF